LLLLRRETKGQKREPRETNGERSFAADQKQTTWRIPLVGKSSWEKKKREKVNTKKTNLHALLKTLWTKTKEVVCDILSRGKTL